MLTLRSSALVAAFILVAPVASWADTLVGSWNVRHLGWGEDKDMMSVARIASAFDLLALQEVMSIDALADLERAVEAITGEAWEVMASEAIGRGSYREHYAFLWRSAEVSWLDGAVVYIDDRDAFAREPFSARFLTADNYELVLASAHLIYGDSVEEREREAVALARYRHWLDESFPGSPVYIAGDFNLPPSSLAWQPLGQVSAPLIQTGATTLSTIDGRFANLYDNIWAPASIPVPISQSGIFDFPSELGFTHTQARESISDHAPVWMLLDPGAVSVVLDPHFYGRLIAQEDLGRETAAASRQADDAIRGNINSMIYHRPDCPGYGQMAERNRVLFADKQAAEEAGYREARNCP